MIQLTELLTEEQYLYIRNKVRENCKDCQIGICEVCEIKQLKEAGIIKKTALEKFHHIHNIFMEKNGSELTEAWGDGSDKKVSIQAFNRLFLVGEQAISELQQKIKELEGKE